jgi:hypothetical protein
MLKNNRLTCCIPVKLDKCNDFLESFKSEYVVKKDLAEMIEAVIMIFLFKDCSVGFG